ncbi:cell division protein FtsQ/DivIB [Nonomuraea ferruginea]
MTARKVFLVLLTAGVVGTAAWLVFFSPVLGVRTVEIVGNVTLAPDVVRKAAAVPDLHPLATVDLAQVEDRVRGIRQVASAKVDRVWPATLRIEVVEREPVAQIPVGDKIAVIDKTGAVIELRDVAPPMLPVLKVASPAVGDPATMAALDVVRGLPSEHLGAGSPGQRHDGGGRHPGPVRRAHRRLGRHRPARGQGAHPAEPVEAQGRGVRRELSGRGDPQVIQFRIRRREASRVPGKHGDFPPGVSPSLCRAAGAT